MNFSPQNHLNILPAGVRFVVLQVAKIDTAMEQRFVRGNVINVGSCKKEEKSKKGKQWKSHNLPPEVEKLLCHAREEATRVGANPKEIKMLDFVLDRTIGDRRSHQTRLVLYENLYS